MASTALPVAEGALSSFLGFCFLAASDFEFVTKYFFDIFLMICVFGTINALIFLPAILGLFGSAKSTDDFRHSAAAAADEADPSTPQTPKSPFMAAAAGSKGALPVAMATITPVTSPTHSDREDSDHEPVAVTVEAKGNPDWGPASRAAAASLGSPHPAPARAPRASRPSARSKDSDLEFSNV